jgi:hypothetical protein
MALSKVDYNSLNVTAAASKALKWNSGADGFETGDVGGSMVLLATETASSDATISFTSGIDSTYKEYVFKFIGIHCETNAQAFTVGFRDGGSSYDATKTSTVFYTEHGESGSGGAMGYHTSRDIAQGTGFQDLLDNLGNENDENLSGYLHLFDPSSTTFVKHWLSRTVTNAANDYIQTIHTAGYCNVTTAIDGVQFKMNSGDIDAGVIKMYGVT